MHSLAMTSRSYPQFVSAVVLMAGLCTPRLAHAEDSRALRAGGLGGLQSVSVSVSVSVSAEAPAAESDLLTVDTSGLADRDMRDPVAKAVHRDSAPVLALYVKMGGSLDDVAVRVQIADQGGSAGAPGDGYAYTLKAEAIGSAAVQVEGACSGCTERELVKAVTDALPELLGKLDKQRGREPAQGDSSGEPEGPDQDPNGSGRDSSPDPKRSPLGTPGKAGVALLVVGVPTLVAGIGLAVRADQSSGEPGAIEQTSTHTPGYVLIGVGAASAIAGAALLATDRVRARRSPSSQARATSFGAAPMRGGMSVSVGFRF